MKSQTYLSLAVMLTALCGAPAGAAEQVSETAAGPPAWSLDTPSGETVSFPHEHDGPVVLLFWASWCPFCKALMPHLQSILDEYPQGALTMYAINFRDDGDPVEHMQSNGFEFTLLLDGGEVAKAYDVHATPGLLIFDADDRLALNLYDVMEEYNQTVTLPDDLSFKQKAARKAPWWAARIRMALDELADGRVDP